MEIAEVTEMLWPEVHEFNYTGTPEEQFVEHTRDMRKRYGDEIVDKYLKMCEVFQQQPSRDADQAIIEFVLETGLTDFCNYSTLLRSRTTFSDVANYVRKRNPKTLVDIGSGEGKMALGLAATVESLERIYACDISPSAHKRLKANIQRVNGNRAEIVRAKVTDCYSESFIDLIRETSPDGVDVAVIAHPTREIPVLLSFVREVVNIDGRIVGCFDVQYGAEAEMQPSVTMHTEQLTLMGEYACVRFDDFSCAQYKPGALVLTAAGSI
jgi:SAM-dependent methyltransferase